MTHYDKITLWKKSLMQKKNHIEFIKLKNKALNCFPKALNLCMFTSIYEERS